MFKNKAFLTQWILSQLKYHGLPKHSLLYLLNLQHKELCWLFDEVVKDLATSKRLTIETRPSKYGPYEYYELVKSNKKTKHVRRLVVVGCVAFLLEAVTGFKNLGLLENYIAPKRPKPKRTDSTGGR